MGDPLRQRRAPAELAGTEQVIEINDKISDYARLAQIVEIDLAALEDEQRPSGWCDAPIVGRLQFGYADGHDRRPALEGEVRVRVHAVCQRCLEAFELPLVTKLKLLLSTPERPAVPRDDYETWELADEQVVPADIVEEALVMALPLSAMHDNEADCTTSQVADAPAQDTIRPFAALRAQMDASGD